MSETPPEVSSAENEPRPRRGVSMPVGIAVAVITAALTCAAGLAIMGRPTPPPPEPVPVPQPAIELPADGSVDAADGAADGGDAGGDDATTDAASDGTTAALTTPEPTPAPAARESSENPDCSMADKDIAREAWRRNLPTICHSADGRRASMYVPVRGSLENATYGVRRKPAREARVDLPEAESLLTMAQYKLDRDGFVDLKPSESGSGGALLRIRLQKTASDPVFELKEGFVKITVAVPR